MSTTNGKEVPRKNIGEWVTWYPHGDLNQIAYAALVYGQREDGGLVLEVRSKRSRPRTLDLVYHHSVKRTEQQLTREGCWAEIGHYEANKAAEKAKKEAEKAKSQSDALATLTIGDDDEDPDEDQLRVIMYARELGDIPRRSVAVAERIGGGMTFQRVNAIIAKYPHLMTGKIPDHLVTP